MTNYFYEIISDIKRRILELVLHVIPGMGANCTVDLDLDLECWRILGHIIAAGGGDQVDILLHALLHCCAPKQWTAGHSKEIPLHCLGESGDRQIWTKADRPPYSALNGHLPQLLISDSRGFSHQIRFLENL